VVRWAGREVCRVSTGNTDPHGGGVPTTAGTPFDLASLTKLFTGAAALRLAAEGQIELDSPVTRYLSDFEGRGKELVSVRHLLTHTSGLPPGPALYGPDAPADPRAALLAVPLSHPPGQRVVYSDTGVMVLGLVIETLTGHGLDGAIETLVCAPLGIRDTRFGPRPEAAATEWDAARGCRIRGEVHDENAAALGGIAGHAGLFGTAGDVMTFARAFAECDTSFLPAELIAAATTEQAAEGNERRGIAWKLRSPDPEAPEHAFSPDTFGHYGFTGTALWHDPRREATVVLLTNRVYFGRQAEPVRRLRTELFRLIGRTIPCRGGSFQFAPKHAASDGGQKHDHREEQPDIGRP
jgi:CubicO group peptidase (beta-lactamase class C family)